MSGLPRELRDLIESGPMAHLSTINADGSPQVSVIWVGLDGDDLVSGHMRWYAKLRNIDRDPRVVLSFDAPRAPGVFLNPYAVLHARATIQPSDDAWDLLDRLTKVYCPLTPSSRRRRVPATSCTTPSSASAASAHGCRPRIEDAHPSPEQVVDRELQHLGPWSCRRARPRRSSCRSPSSRTSCCGPRHRPRPRRTGRTASERTPCAGCRPGAAARRRRCRGGTSPGPPAPRRVPRATR